MPQFLQAFGYLGQPLRNQGLDIFTEGEISGIEGKQGSHVGERQSGRLRGTDEANDLEGVPGIEPILVLRP